MAVLIECISVVIRASRLLKVFPGGWPDFQRIVPNQMACADNELARVAFMNPHDVQHFVGQLESLGLAFRPHGKAVDLAVVDQLTGFTVPCEWAIYGRANWDNDPKKPVAICELIGSKVDGIVTPPGWKYENSMSAQSVFVDNDQLRDTMQFLRHENGLDVYRDRRTGEIRYIGRTGPNPKPY